MKINKKLYTMNKVKSKRGEKKIFNIVLLPVGNCLEVCTCNNEVILHKLNCCGQDQKFHYGRYQQSSTVTYNF